MSRDVEELICTEQRIGFKNGSLPISQKKCESCVVRASPFVAKQRTDKVVRKYEGDDAMEKVKEEGNCKEDKNRMITLV